MPSDGGNSEQVDNLLQTPDLAGALDNEQFKSFLNQVPIAIGVSSLDGKEAITYVNPEFERLSGFAASELQNQDWEILKAEPVGNRTDTSIGAAIKHEHERAGTFKLQTSATGTAIVDTYTNLILNDDASPCFRLVALVDVTAHEEGEREALERRIREKDMLLRELQHRVKNNLQMVTALIRLEARSHPNPETTAFERLAARINSLSILYEALSTDGRQDEVDLGAYLGQIASAVMRSHSREGISFDEKLDSYPVSVNVAMPCGLAVNELLMNSLKHAFREGEEGTITLRCEIGNKGCRVVVADDGIGIPEGETWPKRGKLGELIAQTLRENAKADIEVRSSPGSGMEVAIIFGKSDATAT